MLYLSKETLNVGGLREKDKRFDIFDTIKNRKTNVFCCQEGHLTGMDLVKIKSELNAKICIACDKTNAGKGGDGNHI